MDPIKEAFFKIKQDVDKLREELDLIKQALLELYDLQTTKPKNKTNISLPTDQHTIRQTSQTDKLPLEGLRDPHLDTSTGNGGVPTDKPTNRPTDQHPPISSGKPPKSEFERASEALTSLDNIKKEIRLKFKQLTPQEMSVFEILYSLEDQKVPEISYKMLANHLNLSESSIREYINKLIKKGVPVLKIRQNNKKILLNIDQNLKNLASLETILHLREI